MADKDNWCPFCQAVTQHKPDPDNPNEWVICERCGTPHKDLSDRR